MSSKMDSRLPLNLIFISFLLSVSLLSIYQQEQLLHHTSLQPSLSLRSRNDVKHHTPTAESITNQHPSTVTKPSSSSLLLKAALQTPRPIPDASINHTQESQRCNRYGLTYTPSSTRRKIYWGASIADDTWHIIATQAIETYGLFDTVAFVESNRTSMGNVRKLRFGEGSANRKRLESMFGEDTRVSVDYYANEDEGKGQLVSLEREHAQRALILERWKKNGMTAHDIGYLSDTDEMFSRDFLRAMQICNVPQFQPEGENGHERCAKPKVYGLVAIFEGSPGCVSAEEIYHPALVSTLVDASVHYVQEYTCSNDCS